MTTDFGPGEVAWSKLPPITVRSARGEAERIVLETTAGPLAITGHEWGVRLRFGASNADAFPILIAQPQALPIALSGDTITWHGHRLDFTREPLAFALHAGEKLVLRSPTDAHFTRRHRLPPFARTATHWFAAFDLPSGAPVYGLGEKWGPLDKRGQYIRSAVFDALGVNAERSYKNTPFAWSPNSKDGGWGVFTHTTGDVAHAVGHSLWSQRAYAVAVEDGGLDLFLIAGADGAALLGSYTALTGRAALPPAWSMGAILSRAYYRTAEEILAAAHKVRAKKLPIDTITFDGRAWQDTPTRFHFFFDPARYPDPKPTLAELRRLGFRICLWEYPLVAVDGPYFAEMAAKGWLLKDRRTGEPYVYTFDSEPFGAVLTQLPPSGIVDFTHPDAYAWWRDQHRALFEMGCDMVKTDFGEQVKDDCLAHNGQIGRALRNVYPLLYNACVHEAGAKVLLGRAGWAGSQRYPAQWGGDPQADWEGLAASIRGGLSWGLSGGPFFATDIGGFYADERDPELYVRWAQAAAFFSHFRFHGIGEREPWSYGAEADAAVRKVLGWRYRLLPYLHAMARRSTETGLPLQQAMPLAFPEDRLAWRFDQQWLCGDDLLVMACVQPGGTVEGYLPLGWWRRFPDGAVVEGGRMVSLTLALDEFAVFARESARIALGAEIERVEGDGPPPVVGYWP